MTHAIVYIDMGTFFVSYLRLKNSQLNRIFFIVESGNRGAEVSCLHQAKYFEVRTCMLVIMVLQLCPQAKNSKGSMELFSNKSHKITQLIEEKVPLVKKTSIDYFIWIVQEMIALYQTMDKIKNRFCFDAAVRFGGRTFQSQEEDIISNPSAFINPKNFQ